MSTLETQIKDLTEIERLIIGNSLNFTSNILALQIFHIENHDPEMLKLIRESEQAQEEFILLKSSKRVADELNELMGSSFNECSVEEIESLKIPIIRLESLFKSVFEVINCNDSSE